MQVAVREPNAPQRVVFDGQSYNNWPVPPNNYPSVLMRGRKIPWHNASVDGWSWAFLATNATTRLHPQLTVSDYTVLILQGGQGDITNTPGSGSTAYTRISTYADNARAAGADYIIATTMPPASFLFPPGGQQETERLSHNTLLLADANGAFDTIVDIADLAEPTYNDTVHPNILGAQIIAQRLAGPLDVALGP